MHAVDVDGDALERARDDDAWPTERVTLQVIDVRDTAALEAAFAAAEALAPVDVMMNIAGVLRPEWCTELHASHVDLQIDVNFKALVHGTRVASHAMVARRRGHIVNVASMAALAPIPGISVYSATKFAARAFSLCASLELEDAGVAVSCVCPDAVETPMLVMQEDHDASAITFSGGNPLRAEDVAALICGRVLESRPREVAIPLHRKRLAMLANFFPRLADWLYPRMLRRGQRLRDRRLDARVRSLPPSG